MPDVSRRRLLGALGGAMVASRAPRGWAQTPPTQREFPLVSLASLPSLDLDPAPGFEAAWATSLMFDTPLTPGPDGTPAAGIVVGMSFSADRLALDLTIRPDALFADFTPVTTRDVAASIERARLLSSNTAAGWRFANLRSAIAVDSAIVRIELTQPDVTVPFTLATSTVPIIPERWSERLWSARLQPEALPPGSGPFQLTHQIADRMTFERHSGYWQVGRPHLPGLELAGPEDRVLRSTQLVTGDVDVVVDTPLLDVPILQQDPGITLVGDYQNRLCYLEVNMRSRTLAGPNLRSLLTSAIDRTALVAGAIATLGTPSERLLPSGHWAAGDDVSSIARSPEQVRQGLAEMGLTPGLPINLIANEDDASLANTCVLLQDQLAYAGFAVNLNLLSIAEMETAIKNGTYDLRAVYSPYWRDPHELIHSLLASDGMANRGGFASLEVDVLLNQAASQPYPDYRAVRYGAVQRVASMLTPVIPLFTPRYIDAMSSRLVEYPSLMPVSALGFRKVSSTDAGTASD